MATNILTHKTCKKNIKALRRVLPDILSFDYKLSSTTTLAPLPEADSAGYDCNIYFLQDKLFEYYARRDRELDEDRTTFYDEDPENECIIFAFDSLMELLVKITDHDLQWNIIVDTDRISVAVVNQVDDIVFI